MSKITIQRRLRKFAGAKLPTGKHYEWADYNGERFPVLMSTGQIVNIKKAYKRYKDEKNNKKSS